MDKIAQKLISNLNQPQIKDGVLFKITDNIHKRQKQSRFLRLCITLITLIGSLVALCPAFINLSQTITESGFFQYLSLIFSDLQSVWINGSSFGLAVLEALPVFDTIIFLALIFVGLESLRYLVKNIFKFNFKSYDLEKNLRAV